MKRLLFVVALCIVGIWVSTAKAALVTDSSGFTNPLVIDFSQYTGCSSFASAGCAAPLDVGGLVGQVVNFTATPGFGGGSAYNDGFGLGANGSWNSGRAGYIGLNTSSGFLSFEFADGPVSAAGAFMNYAPFSFGTAEIEVFNAAHTSLELYSLPSDAPISTPSATNAGAFRGVLRSSADISFIEFRNSFTVLDDLTFAEQSAAVPEPATVVLLGTGLFGLAWVARRRRV